MRTYIDFACHKMYRRHKLNLTENDTGITKATPKFYKYIKTGPMGIHNFSISSGVGFRINPTLSIGLGTSLDCYTGLDRPWLLTTMGKMAGGVFTPTKGISAFLPVFLDVRFVSNYNRWKLYPFANLGYAFSLKTGQELEKYALEKIGYYYTVNGGAILWAFGVSSVIFTYKKTDVFLEMGIKYQTFFIRKQYLQTIGAKYLKGIVLPFINIGISF